MKRKVSAAFFLLIGSSFPTTASTIGWTNRWRTIRPCCRSTASTARAIFAAICSALRRSAIAKTDSLRVRIRSKHEAQRRKSRPPIRRERRLDRWDRWDRWGDDRPPRCPRRVRFIRGELGGVLSRNQPSEGGMETEPKAAAETFSNPLRQTAAKEPKGSREAAKPASSEPAAAASAAAVKASNAVKGAELRKAAQPANGATPNKAGGARMGTFRRLWHF